MTIAKTAARKQYSGNDSTDVFAFPYRFFADGDLQVYLLDAGGTETLQTITTHYTVSNNGDETGGNVTMVTPPATGETLTIIRRIPQTQSTDYADNDAFPAETHEAALDRLTLIVQDMQEELDRSVTVDVSESVDVDTLQANISTLAAIDSDITTVAGISANVTTVAGISANVTTVAGISANVTTVAGISADVTTVANDGTDIGIVAGDTTHIQALGPISADITTVSGISANVTTVAGISANVTTVAGISANVTTVAGISADVTTVAGISADVTALAAGSWPTWLKLTFDTTTAAADPGAGKIRFNNATPASVTALYIDNADADTNDISGLLDSWTPGQIMVRQVSDPTKWAVFNVASVADSTGYRTFTVTYVDGGTLPDNSGTVGIGFAIQGADGAGTLNNIVEDTTPQLGGQLDVNGQAIGDGTRELITFTEDASAVNHVNIENEATGSGPIISAAGDDANIDLLIGGKGTGHLKPTTEINMNSMSDMWSKGADVASAAELLVLTDGNYFDVTGTTSITSIEHTADAFAIGSVIVLQFDGALTLTHHATDLILPGAANITTAAGDTAMFVKVAAGDWKCVQYTVAATAPGGGGGGGWAFIASTDLSNDATADFTGLNSGSYDAYMFVFQNVIPATDARYLTLRLSTDGGSSYSSATDYTARIAGVDAPDTFSENTGETSARLTDSGALLGVGSGTWEDGMSGSLFLYAPHLSLTTQFDFRFTYENANGDFHAVLGFGWNNARANHNAVRFLMNDGNLESGTITMYGTKNA